jgi:hypothetical protein
MPMVSQVRVTVSGSDEVRAALGRLGKAGALVAKDVIKRTTTRMVAMAKPLTPDDPETQGELRDTVRIVTPSASRTGKATGGIQAGPTNLGKRGYSASALIQHEDLTLHHTSGGPKYLERPFMALVVGIPEEIKAGLDKVANAG